MQHESTISSAARIIKQVIHLHMKGAQDRNMIFPCQPDGCVSQLKGEHGMDDVQVFENGSHAFLVRLGQWGF